MCQLIQCHNDALLGIKRVNDFSLTWPGMKSFRIIGSPLIKASAIVPGPAYWDKGACKDSSAPQKTDRYPNSSSLVIDSDTEKIPYLCYNAVTSSHPLLHLRFEPSHLQSLDKETTW